MSRRQYRTKYGEIIWTEPGDRADGDRKIYFKVPRQPWAPSLEFCAILARLKGHVEENNYPRSQGKSGRKYISHFYYEAIMKHYVELRELCRKFKIPGY